MSTSSLRRTRRFRVPLVVLGGLAFLLGLLAILAPALANAIPVQTLVAILGNDYILVAIFAAVAILVVLAVLGTRVVVGIDQATPPDPEKVHDVPRLGEPFDQRLSSGGFTALLGTDHYRAVRTRLRDAAVATVMRGSNCTRASARDRVDRGTWTDDPAAASFLAAAPDAEPDPETAAGAQPDAGEEPVWDSSGPSGSDSGRASESEPGRVPAPISPPGLAARVKAALGGETQFQYAARRTADEIVARDPEVTR